MRRVFSVCFCALFLLLALGGCGSSWQAQFPVGARLYERPGHIYFGKVVGYDARHEFANEAGARPAILIAQAAGGGEIWGACQTCTDSMDIEKP
jgi:hypothetical protein